jgi:hypothetical protein
VRFDARRPRPKHRPAWSAPDEPSSP